MSVLRWLCGVLMTVISGYALAQSPPSAPRTPTLWVGPDQQPIRLSEVDITIRATGMVAETLLDLRFENPNAQMLEGELVFPLLPGQTVAGYALEVNGTLREGVVVPQQTARLAFESSTWRGVDPGLAELIAGNVFRTRLYPIPAESTKRVQLKVVSALEDAGRHWRYQLPMQFAAPVSRFGVRAEVVADYVPMVEAHCDPELTFRAEGPRWVAELTRTEIQPRRPLAFLMPKGAGAETVVVAADERAPEWRSVVAHVYGGDSWPRKQSGPFPFRLEIGNGGVQYVKTRHIPKEHRRASDPVRIALYVDASRRAIDRPRAVEASLLTELIWRIGEVEVVLIPFRDVAEPPRRIRLTGRNAEPLLQVLKELPLDGGASYGAIDLAAAGPVEMALVLGDGLNTFGPSEPRLSHVDGRRPPVHVLLNTSSGDPMRLNRIARTTGGVVVDLRGFTIPHFLRVVDAVAEMREPNWRLISARAESGECTDLSPVAPVAVRGVLTIHARCRGAGSLVLVFGNGSDPEVIRRVDYAAAEPVEPALASAVHQLWAQARIAELETAAEPDEARITELGVRYGVVTRTTSLLVLDRVEDYVRYRVEPKVAGLRARYRALVALFPEDRSDRDHRKRLDELYARWQAFRAKHEHPDREVPPGPVPQPSVKLPPISGRIGSRVLGVSPPELPRARVELVGWQPDVPYLATLREARDLYAEYLRLREQYGTQPSYYLDAADLLREAKQPALAQRVLSNLAALDPGNTALLRVMAYRLMQWGTPVYAAAAFEVALKQRPKEPQSHRDLALAYARLPKPERVKAARLLWTVATRDWEGYSPDIELIALHELNGLLAEAGNAAPRPEVLGIDPRFLEQLPVGLRVVLTWDANDTDVDLWVVDPAGERTHYGMPRSRSGGQLSRDFRTGYGPEVYTIRRPLPGTYRVLVNYFGDFRQTLTGPLTLQLAFQTGFNTVSARESAVTVRLGDARETQEIGTFRVEAPE